jgi:hypothetical protein
MTRKLIVRRRAELQAASARDWYDEQTDSLELGDRFIRQLDAAISMIQENPLIYQKIFREIRRVLLPGLPQLKAHAGTSMPITTAFSAIRVEIL